MNKTLVAELLELTPTERIELAAALWDSIGPDDMPPLTQEQIKECERRLTQHCENPDCAVPWEEVRARLRARFG